MNTLLMIGADKMEFEGIRQRVSQLRELPWGLPYAEEGVWQERKVMLVANGAGPARGARAFQSAIDKQACCAVLNTGYCGGFDPDLVVGDIVAATAIDAPEVGQRFEACLPQESPAAAHGVILSIDRVAVTAAEKRKLRETGASAVEMEAAGIAPLAARSGLPFYCIRVVSDAADESLPLDFNLYRDTDGGFNRGAIARAVLARPLSRVKALLRLQRNSKIASMKLGEFLADCRF